LHDNHNIVCGMATHLCIRIREHKRFERRRQVSIKAGGGRYVIQLRSTNSSDHPDVSTGVLEPSGERRDKVLDEVGNAEGAEAAECQAAYGGVLVVAVALEEVDGEEREVRVVARVDADVEVAHLLQHDVGGGGAEHHLPERRRHVDAGRHAGDHPLEDVPPLVVGVGRAAPRQLPQLLLQIRHLALPGWLGRGGGLRRRGRRRSHGGCGRGDGRLDLGAPCA
jgi:hypothetical protein